MYMCVPWCVTSEEITGQLVRVSSLLPRGSWGWNSGCQAWWQAPLLARLSCQPYSILFIIHFVSEITSVLPLKYFLFCFVFVVMAVLELTM